MMKQLFMTLFGTLRKQLVSGMIIFCIVAIGIIVLNLVVKQQGLLIVEKTTQAEALSRSVAVSASGWLINRDFYGLQEIVDAQTNYPELAFAMILDENNMVVAHTDRGRLGQYVTDIPPKNETVVMHNTPDLIDVMSPVLINGNRVGWVRVGLNRHITTVQLDAITRDSIMYGLAAIFVASLMAYFMGEYITRRIHAIQAVVDAVQSGDLTKRADVSGEDEAAALAKQFNSMLDKIAADKNTLKDSETRYRAIFNDSPIAIWEEDFSALKARLEYLRQSGIKDIGTYLDDNPDEVSMLVGLVLINDANQASINMLGAKHKDQVFINPPRYFPEESLEIFKRQIVALDAGNTRFRGEMPIRTISGESILVELSLIIQPDELETWAKVLVSFTDITERKQSEEKIKQFNEELEGKVLQRTLQLEAANKDMELFSYSVSHDLRAPLRAIDGFSVVLVEDYGEKLGDEGMSYLNRIRAAAQKMGILIDDLLSLPRLTMEELKKTDVNMGSIASEVIGRLRDVSPERDVEVIIADNMLDEADLHFMEIVLTNLLGNAWKFTSGKDKGKIEFNCTQKEGNKVYYIKDNGVGFDMSYIDKLFRPFQRLHTTEEFAGNGIGLATVARIIKKHGGRVWAEGEVGKGSTFYFTLKGG